MKKKIAFSTWKFDGDEGAEVPFAILTLLTQDHFTTDIANTGYARHLKKKATRKSHLRYRIGGGRHEARQNWVRSGFANGKSRFSTWTDGSWPVPICGQILPCFCLGCFSTFKTCIKRRKLSAWRIPISPQRLESSRTRL